MDANLPARGAAVIPASLMGHAALRTEPLLLRQIENDVGWTRMSSWRTAPRTGLSLLACVLSASRASAEEPKTARLRYSVRAPADLCPDEASFRALVAARLGRDPFLETADDEITIVIEANSKGVEGHFTIASSRRKPAERRFSEGRSGCEPLAEAVATATALALDPLGNGPSLPALPPPASSPPAAALPPPEIRTVDAVAPIPSRERTRIRFAARGGVVGTIGLAPGATAGGDVAIGLERGGFLLFLEGRAESQVTDARGDRGDRLEATLLGGALAPCGRVGALFGCLVARVGVIQGRAPDLPSPSLGSSMHAAFGPRLGLWVPFGAGFAVTAAAEIFVPVVRTTFFIGGEPAWVASPIAGGLVIGMGFVGL